MSAGQYNFTIEQGTDVRVRFEWTDSNGTAIDLTGANCRMHWRKAKSTTSKLVADVSEYLTLTGPQGRVDLHIPGEDADDFTFDTARYSLRVDRPSDKHRLIEGVVTNSRETTE